MIKQFIRAERKVGVMVGVCIDGIICIGISAVTPGDKFDPVLGTSIAAGRALKARRLMPRYIDELEEFASRCKRYFKGAEFAPYVKEFLGLK
mgnify:CR=1 FL=1